MQAFLLSADDVNEAYNLIKDLEPTTPQEYILKGVVNAALGQEQGSVSIEPDHCSSPKKIEKHADGLLKQILKFLSQPIGKGNPNTLRMSGHIFYG